MIDRNLLINDYENTKRRLMRKKVIESDIERARELILNRRKAATEYDDLKGKLNAASSQIGDLMRAGKRSEADDQKATLTQLKADLSQREERLKELDNAVDVALMLLPNLPDDRVPSGRSEADNRVLRHEGHDESYYQSGTWLPHWDIAERLGLLDTKRAAKMSGSMFAILRGDGARLLRALINYATDLNRDRYEEMVCPHLVRTETLMGTGHLPKFADDAFKIPEDDLWAIPTGEVPLTAFHNDEILALEDLPLRYMTYTACFRREAGSAGKDTRGLLRLHEFHKLELVHLVPPEQGDEAFAGLLADAERPLRELGLPYRILDLCAGDMSPSSARMHDIEVYAPGVQKWLECSSVGLFTDYQARRGKMRFRRDAKSKPETLYTLNGSGLASPRVLAAILEHYFDPTTNKVNVPVPLRRYMGKDTIG